MKLLKEIFHDENLNLQGKILIREAIRAIILDRTKLLMIYSPKNGDYKFPGGGVNAGETYEQALIREVQEECGATISKIEDEFGTAIEYKIPKEAEYDVIKMISNYYICQVSDTNLGEQNLDEYEKDLGFTPIWVDIDEAININQSIINSKSTEEPRWTKRDTFVLEKIREQLVC